jgi:hypothetical protein
MNDGLQTPTLRPLAIGGVWSWRQAKMGVEVIPDLDRVLRNKKVYIAFDMDNPVNPMVRRALERLVDALMNVSKCRVLVLGWHHAEGKGLDDYLCGCTAPRDALQMLLVNAQASGHVAKVLSMNDNFVYDEAQDMIYNFNMGGYIKPQTFKSHYFTEKVGVNITQGNKTTIKHYALGDYWLSSPARAACEGKTFAPGAERLVPKSPESPIKQINTWSHWGAGSDLRKLQPIKGDVEPFIDYLKATFGDNKLVPGAPAVDIVDYLIKRMAWMFQHPQIKHPTWIYLIGKPLQGKSKLINILSRLIGYQYTSHIDEGALNSSFQEWRAEKLLIAFDDVRIMERSQIKQVLKRLTTENTARVNKKYEREYTAKSYESFLFATNSLDALLDHDDRRALVLEAECPWTKDEWLPFDRWAGTPSNYNALLYYFMYEVKIDDSFLTLRPPLTFMRQLVTESAESGWDEFLNILAAPMPIQWISPADRKPRKWKPTIMTPEMIRALYALINGPQEQRNEIKGATLTSKLQRFGATRIHPADSSDPRARLYVISKQTTAWCWDKRFIKLNSADLMTEIYNLEKQFPELFSGYDTTVSKF